MDIDRIIPQVQNFRNKHLEQRRDIILGLCFGEFEYEFYEVADLFLRAARNPERPNTIADEWIKKYNALEKKFGKWAKINIPEVKHYNVLLRDIIAACEGYLIKQRREQGGT